MGRLERGFSLLELAVVAVVLSALSAILLQRLNYYQEAAERAHFETTLQVYKTGLQIRLAEMILERRENEARRLEDENPTLWLSEKPTNYAGDYPSVPVAGSWYYDKSSRELVYVANTATGLEVAERDGLKQLRFRVQVVRQPVAITGGKVEGIAGIKLAPVSVYRWS
ncbi:MAG: type II secretion system protein [Burkholderiales bacterium]